MAATPGTTDWEGREVKREARDFRGCTARVSRACALLCPLCGLSLLCLLVKFKLLCVCVCRGARAMAIPVTVSRVAFSALCCTLYNKCCILNKPLAENHKHLS